MGGRGSGWQGERKTTVETGLILDIKKLVAMGARVPGAYRRGSLTWQCDGSEFEYELELRQDGTGSLFLRCVGPGQQFFVTGFRYAPPCPITAAGGGGSSVRSRKSASQSCTCPQARQHSQAAKPTA
jgi:hypothetical protein